MQLLLLLQLNAHGNSATATKLATARNIKLQGAVSGNANFDGSGNVIITTTQANIAILTGTLTLADGYASGTINYPNGFNSSNCVVLSFMAHNTSAGNVMGYGYVEKSVGYIAGAIGHCVSMKRDNINIHINNPTDGSHSSGTDTFAYKIVLMKVS